MIFGCNAYECFGNTKYIMLVNYSIVLWGGVTLGIMY